jgi:hypothetical protein
MIFDAEELVNRIASETASRVLAILKSGEQIPTGNATEFQTTEEPACEYLDIAGVAKHFGISKQAVYAWRSKHIGPPYRIVNGKSLYKKSDLDPWAAKRTIRPE